MAKDRLQKEEIRKEPIIEFLKKESMSIPKSFRSDSEICLALLHSPLSQLEELKSFQMRCHKYDFRLEQIDESLMRDEQFVLNVLNIQLAKGVKEIEVALHYISKNLLSKPEFVLSVVNWIKDISGERLLDKEKQCCIKLVQDYADKAISKEFNKAEKSAKKLNETFTVAVSTQFCLKPVLSLFAQFPQDKGESTKSVDQQYSTGMSI